jgi:hypothetical protein
MAIGLDENLTHDFLDAAGVFRGELTSSRRSTMPGSIPNEVGSIAQTVVVAGHNVGIVRIDRKQPPTV